MEKKKELFILDGLHCTDCARTIEKGVLNLQGIEGCTVDYTNQKMHITGDFNEDTVLKRVKSLGYRAVPARDHTPDFVWTNNRSPTNFLQYLLQTTERRNILFSIIIILPAFFLEELFGYHHALISLFSISALLLAGIPIIKNAAKSLYFSREININVLMSIAAMGALVIGYHTEAGMVMVLFALGEELEGFSSNQARNSIKTLINLIPKTATLVTYGQDDRIKERLIPIDQIRKGDILLIKPGEKIPTDGVIVKGDSHVNQSPITGESKLVRKELGSPVIASSVNYEGVLEIKVTHTIEDNTISRLIRLVEGAQEKKAKSQRFINRFARIYTPIVIVIAFLVAVLPPLFFNQPFLSTTGSTTGWLYRGLALLVVSCPCALVISTPVSIISAIGNAARSGVLIKGGSSLETLSIVKAIAFDKTGTLTKGEPKVININSIHCNNQWKNSTEDGDFGNDKPNEFCQNCLDLLISATEVELRSNHPLGNAIIELSRELSLLGNITPADDIKTIPGKGVFGYKNGDEILLGRHSEIIGEKDDHYHSMQTEIAKGRTIVTIQKNSQYLGYISISDSIRSSSRRAIEMLKQRNINKIFLLTGDNKQTAKMIGNQLGIEDIQSELLPEDKLDALIKIKKNYGKVAMVGDGINDTPALAYSDVGIAMGNITTATEQAVETADISLMGDDLKRIPYLFDLSIKTRNTILTNIVLSISIKVGFIVLVIFGLSTMWMAVAADMGTSLLVTLYAMRLIHSPNIANYLDIE